MNTEFRKYIKAVGTGQKLSRDLSPEEAERAWQLILEGEASDAQIGALLVPLRMKGETAEELAAFVKVTRGFCHQIHTGLPHLVDCGLSYDGKVKFPHLAPLAAFVAAGAGAAVLLHGQSQTPPKYGISVRDVFLKLGLPIDWDIHEVKGALEEAGVGFLSIEQISPRVAELKRIREELGLRTAFNHIEKLWNPLHAPHQVVAVYHGPYLEAIPKVLQKIGARHALVVQGMEGTPDLRVSRSTKAVELKDGVVEPLFILPKQLGLSARGARQPSVGLGLASGEEPVAEPVFDAWGPEDNADFIHEALRARDGVLRDLAVLNGALLIYASGLAKDIPEALERARESLDSRQALKRLELLRKMANVKQGLKV